MVTYAAVLLSLGPAFAAAPQAQVSGHAGWEGHYRGGEWTPVTLDLDNPGKAQDVRLLVCWGLAGDLQSSSNPAYTALKGRRGPTHRIPVAMPAASRKSYSVTLRAPAQPGMSVWAFATTPGGRPLSVRELPVRPLEPDRKLLVVVGTDRPHGLDVATLERAWVRPDRLPEDWRGYSSLGALLWLDADAGRLRSQAQIDALRSWVSSGGHLLVARDHTAGLSGTFLADLLPVTPGGIAEVEHLDALSPPGTRGPGGPAVILRTAPRPGSRPTVQQDSTPLIVEAIRDAGKVTFLAFDPAKPPFKDWAMAPNVWSWILGPAAQPAPDPPDPPRAPSSIGSDHLAAISSHFPGIVAPAMGKLFIVIVLFLAVAGPADYFLLRLLRRLEITWLTFPAAVLAFTAFILATGAGTMRNVIIQREIVVEDHYVDTSFTRRRAIEAILAPSEISLSSAAAEPLHSNFLARGIFAGVSDETEGVTIGHDADAGMRGWALRRNATGLALADSCSKEPASFAFTVEEAGAKEARVSFRNETKRDLQGALLVMPSGVYELGAIPPGPGTRTGRRAYADPGTLSHVWWSSRVPQPQHFFPDGPEKPLAQISIEDYLSRSGEYERRTIPEPEMNALASRLLVVLSFPADGHRAARVALTGLARSLDATPWVAGEKGPLLLAWATDPGPAVSFDPAPGQRSSVVLLRFFQRRRE